MPDSETGVQSLSANCTTRTSAAEAASTCCVYVMAKTTTYKDSRVLTQTLQFLEPNFSVVAERLRESRKLSPECERLFADELPSQDTHFAAKRRITRVQNFHSGSAFDEK